MINQQQLTRLVTEYQRPGPLGRSPRPGPVAAHRTGLPARRRPAGRAARRVLGAAQNPARRWPRPQRQIPCRKRKPPLGHHLPNRRRRQAARTATQEVRWSQITITAPKVGCKKGWPPVTLWAVHAHEPHPPAGVAAIDWMLLSRIHAVRATGARPSGRRNVRPQRPFQPTRTRTSVHHLVGLKSSLEIRSSHPRPTLLRPEGRAPIE